MIYEEGYEELDLEIRPDRRHAQILLKVTDSSKSDEEAEKLIKSLGVQIISKSALSTYWLFFKLDITDMGNVALKPTEHGFTLEGINALP